jgi:hypothetical protein
MIKWVFSLLLAAGCLHGYAGNDLDRVDVYLNGRLAGTWTVDGVLEIHLDTLHQTDTIAFHAWTNFENGLRNATLDIRDNSGVLLSHINSSLGANFEAHFTYIFKPQSVNLSAINKLQAVITLAPEQDVVTISIANISMPGR